MDDLISRSALLEAFGEEPLVWDSRDREDVQMHNDWLDYTKLVKEAPAVDASPKWASVKDRLPEREGRYLCVKRIGKSGMVYVQIMNGDSCGFSMEHIYTDDVTHWMPLPEPPKEV